MRKKLTINDEVLGDIEIVEPSFSDAQILFDQGKDVKFGLELVRLSIYRGGKRLLEDPELSLSEGQAAMKYVGEIMDLCGFGEKGKK